MAGSRLVFDKLQAYRTASHPLPAVNRLWPLYGRGFENLGRDGRWIETPMPQYGPDQLLVRHDACGICYSDIKVIRAGEDHPRLRGKDMRHDPVVLGHEVTLTVVGVGEGLADRFAVGQRFVVQAEIYYRGRNLAYGYMLQGGMSQYSVLGDEVLRGDAGCYLLPVQPETGYAQAALVEPWACVEAAFHIFYRMGLKPGGVTWIIGADPNDRRSYTISSRFSPTAHPATVVLTDVPPAFAAWVTERAAAVGAVVVRADGLAPHQFAAALAEVAPRGPDDAVILGPAHAETITAAFGVLGRGGILNLVSDVPLPEPVALDTAWIHYEGKTVVGGSGPDIAAAYRPIRTRLRANGRLWLLGAAGPMGQMHLQRALLVSPHPLRIVATNRSSARIDILVDKYGDLARRQGIGLAPATEETMGKTALDHWLADQTEGQGFDDIIVLAASTAAIEEAARFLAPGGVLNLFVGLPKGNFVTLDLNPVRDGRQVRIIGSSGSTLDDMGRVLALTERGRIATHHAVVAITGLDGVPDALRAVSEGRFPGKVVIYPALTGLGLTPLAELETRLPAVFARLQYGRLWTREAEEELLRALL